jgi:peptidoglycan/LPS O-acetylase OafA/YrhL
MTGRLRALDGLRGLLALYILAGHTVPFLRLAAPLGWIGAAVSHGRGAVDLFFILSGMVILRSLDGGNPSPPGALRFLATRAGRLLPVYAVAVGFAAAVLCIGDPFPSMTWLPPRSAAWDIAEAAWPQPWLAHLATHATLTQGLLPPAVLPDAEFAILGPAWSLSTEWQFYLLVAGAMALAARQQRRASVPVFVSGLLLLGFLGCAIDLLPEVWRLGRAFLPREAWYFALGVASHGLLTAKGRGRPRFWFGLAFVAAGVMGSAETRLGSALLPVVWGLCLLCEAPAVPRGLRPLRIVLTAPPMLWFGAISYPLYLIHAPVQRLLMLALAPGAHGDWVMFSLLWGPPAILVPILAAYALHRWVEVPCWRWSRGWAAGLGASSMYESFLVLFFKKEPLAGLMGRARAKERQELLFAKRSKNSHQPIDGG